MAHVFVSYSHHDRRWVDRSNPHNLVPFLADSLRREAVEIWCDPALIPGDQFRGEIEAQIDRAELAILLVSQHFLNSAFIRDVELPRIEARANAGELLVIPILVGHCDWQNLALVGTRHMLPGGPTPLIEFVEREAAWQRTQQEILQAVRKQLARAGGQPASAAAPRRDAATPIPGPVPARSWLKAIAVAVALAVVGVAGVQFGPGLWRTLAGSGEAGRIPLSVEERVEIERRLSGYSEQVRQLPFAVAALQPELGPIAERLWNQRRYGPEAARPVAMVYRLYAASLLLSSTGTSHPGLKAALPWLRRSIELDAGFRDKAELVAANEFLLGLVLKQPADISMKQLLGHEIRIALIEATSAEVDAQVTSALGVLTQMIKQRQPAESAR